MKKIFIGILALTSTSAFAGDYSINGIQVNDVYILTQYREYRGTNHSATCEISIDLSKNKSFFSKSVITKGSRKARCSDLTSGAIAKFVSADGSTALSALLIELGNHKWTEVPGDDMSDEAPDANQLNCRIYADQIQDTTINTLCYAANLKSPNFSTAE